MKTIITIQHTQSVHHTNGMVGSWTDWHLTDLGRQQAQRIAERLAPHLSGKAWTLYSSDLLRAQETAEPVAALLNVAPILRPELRERNLGAAVGKSVAWLRENLIMQEKTVDDRLFHDAESRRDAWNRLAPFFAEMMASEAENIILVSHGDLLSIFNVMWLGLPVEAINSIDLFGMAGGVSFMNENPDGKRCIRRLSDMSFAV
ncbi:MAG: histidine phosphatase family protein [Clostridia bacterium]|nr:histidine phosphatase family protein [Clostridia bacterium]